MHSMFLNIVLLPSPSWGPCDKKPFFIRSRELWHVYTCTHLHVPYACNNAREWACTSRVCACVYTHIACVCRKTYIHAHIHAYMRTYVHTYIRAYVHTVRTYIHTYTHSTRLCTCLRDLTALRLKLSHVGPRGLSSSVSPGSEEL